MAVSAIALAVVFAFADLSKMLEALRLANYPLLLVAFLMSLLWLVVRAVFWRTLLLDRPSFQQTFFTVNEGYLINNLLPFRLGELARAFLLGRKANLAFWHVFSSILIERILDLAMAAALLLSTLPFVLGASWARPASLAAISLVLVGLLCLYFMAHSRERVVGWYEKLAQRFALLDRIGGEQLLAFFQGLEVLRDGSLFLRSLLWLLLNWGVAIAQYYLLLRAFFPQAQFLWGAFSLAVGAVGIAAPSSPGAIGVLEASLVGALALFGLDPSVALAFALSAHLINYLSTGVLGVYALTRDGLTLTGLYKQVQTISK